MHVSQVIDSCHEYGLGIEKKNVSETWDPEYDTQICWIDHLTQDELAANYKGSWSMPHCRIFSLNEGLTLMINEITLTVHTTLIACPDFHMTLPHPAAMEHCPWQTYQLCRLPGLHHRHPLCSRCCRHTHRPWVCTCYLFCKGMASPWMDMGCQLKRSKTSCQERSYC